MTVSSFLNNFKKSLYWYNNRNKKILNLNQIKVASNQYYSEIITATFQIA